MSRPLRPPAAVFEACSRGIAERVRTGIGGTAAAVQFAEFVIDGYPLEVSMLAEVVEAHRLLDQAVMRNGVETRECRVSRNLWGGDAARDWAEAEIETARVRRSVPPVFDGGQPGFDISPVSATHDEHPVSEAAAATIEPLAAELTEAAWLTRIGTRTQRIDARLRTAIDAAMQQAWATIRRELTIRADRALKRVPAGMAAELDMDLRDQILNDLRTDPHHAWRQAQPMCALLSVDLAEAIEVVAADLDLTVTELIADAHENIREAIAEEADIDQAEVDAELVEEQNAAAEAAVALLIALFVAWATGRLNNVDVDEGETAPDVKAPAAIAADIVVAAGGAAVVGAGVSRGRGNRPVGPDGNPVNNLADRWVRQAIEAQSAQALAAAARGNADEAARLAGRIPLQTLRVVFLKEWDYGDKATRFRPYQPHVDKDGRRWITEDEADNELDGEAIGDHIGCQCRAKTTPGLEFTPA